MRALYLPLYSCSRAMRCFPVTGSCSARYFSNCASVWNGVQEKRDRIEVKHVMCLIKANSIFRLNDLNVEVLKDYSSLYPYVAKTTEMHFKVLRKSPM